MVVLIFICVCNPYKEGILCINYLWFGPVVDHSLLWGPDMTQVDSVSSSFLYILCSCDCFYLVKYRRFDVGLPEYYHLRFQEKV